jgi:hypothetical protein
MSEQELSAIYQHPKVKAYVSMTHGEGFGLPLFESAYYGLPIVAPVWSGQEDYLNMPVTDKKGKSKIKTMCAKVDYEIKKIDQEAVWDGVLDKHSSWCFPKNSSYKNKLREVYKDHNRFKSQAKKLQEWVLDTILHTIEKGKNNIEEQIMVL